MIQQNSYKVPGGKLLRISWEDDGSFISKISLCGDFFIYPEDGVSLIEQALSGVPLIRDEIEHAVSKTIVTHSLEVAGFTPADIATALGL